MPLNLWNKNEIELLAANYRQWKYRDIAAMLNKTEQAVKQKAIALGLRKYRNKNEVANQAWDEHSIRELERLYAVPGLSVYSMSRVLHKSVEQIYAKAWRLGLKKTNDNGSKIKTRSPQLSRRRAA